MPLYEYKCCGDTWDSVRRVAERNDEVCAKCLKYAQIQITVSAKPVVYEYYDDGLGMNITGPQHRSRIMKERDLEDK